MSRYRILVDRRGCPAHKDFKAALDAAIGADPASYRANKRQALDGLGFDGPRYSVDVEFTVEDGDHLLEALMGRRSVEVRGSNVTEHRFGIGLPASGPTWDVGPGEKLVAKFAPLQKGDCSIVVRGNDGETVGFDGTFASLPVLAVSKTDQRLVFSTSSFELEARGSGRVSLSIGGPRLEARRLPLREWRALFKLRRLVNTGPTEFEVRERKTGARFEVPLSKAAEDTRASTGVQLQRLLTRIEDLWDQAGARVPEFTERELLEAGQEVDAVHHFWEGGLLEPLTFALPGHDPAVKTELVLIRVMSVGLAGSHVAIAERLVTENPDGGPDFVERERSVARVEEIGVADGAVAEFAKRVSEKFGAHGIMTIAQD